MAKSKSTDATLMVRDEVRPVVARAEALEITDDVSLFDATELLSGLNKRLDTVTEAKEKVTKPLNEALKAERARWKPIETELETAIEAIRGKMTRYRTAQLEAQRAEAEAVAARIKPGKGNLSIEKGLEKLANIERAPEKVETGLGSVRFTEVRRFEVVDKSKLPLEYLAVDEVAIRKAMKAGVEIPGVRYYSEQVPVNNR